MNEWLISPKTILYTVAHEERNSKNAADNWQGRWMSSTKTNGRHDGVGEEHWDAEGRPVEKEAAQYNAPNENLLNAASKGKGHADTDSSWVQRGPKYID